MFIRESKQKKYEPACKAIWVFVGNKFCFKRSDQETRPQNELLTHPDAGGDEEFFKTINRRAYQILTNDVAREMHNIFGPHEA